MTPSHPCLFGAETEYALAAITARGEGVPHDEVHRAFMAAACDVLPHVKDAGAPRYTSIFLTNGGRLYYDCGYRIEYSTPEVTTPEELVRYTRAGDAIVARVAGTLAGRHSEWAEVFVSRGNVDYRHRTAWGAHESVLLRHHAPIRLMDPLLPFLVTRMVYGGAGGFDPFHPGIRFLLSPRAAFTSRVSADNTMANPPIFSTRDEPIARGPYRRLHVTCGETLCSNRALYLRVAATVLVARLLDRSPGAASGLALADPVRALHAIAADPTCRRRVELASGRSMTALEVQRTYLALVEAAAGSRWMPGWAGEACARWRAALDGLERDATACDGPEWPLKWKLYQHHLTRSGFERPELTSMNGVLRALRRRLVGTPLERLAITPQRLDEVAPQAPAAHAEMVGLLGRRGLGLDHMTRMLACRAQLFELDMRWGELGPRGVFRTLEARRAFACSVDTLGDVERAVTDPPTVGRARVRGEQIRRLAAAGAGAACSWQVVFDYDAGTRLDLSDPFEEAPVWA